MLPSSFKCKPSSNKFSAKMLLLSIYPNPFHFQSRFRILFTAITLSFNLFCVLHIDNEIKKSHLGCFLYLVDLSSQSIRHFNSPEVFCYQYSCIQYAVLKHLACNHLTFDSHMSPFISEWWL